MIKANKKKEFFDDFMSEYLSRGFANMPKREIDVLIFYQLQKNGAFDNFTNYEIARRLRTTPNKVKNLKYEAKIRFDNEDFSDENYLKNELKAYFQSPILNIDDKWLYIQIEDPMLLDALKAKLKEGGSLFDGSFNSELIKISAKDYSSLIIKLVYEEEEKKKRKQALKAYKKLKENGFDKISKAIFDKAIDEGGNQGIKFITQQTLNLLSGKFSDVLEIVEPLLSIS